MCDFNAIEIKNLKDQVRSTDLAFRNAEADLFVARYELADTTKALDKYREMCVKMCKANSELRKERDNTKSELSVVRSNLADAAAALDTCRKMCAKMANTILTLTEERDLARDLFRCTVNEYADLLERHSKTCDTP